MARGWESKAVEAQQDEAAEPNKAARVRLTRQLERTQQERHRAVLERAMAELQERIQQLGAATAKPATGQ